ncbi:MAG: 2-amino-4-hydroxy-6-hydroxymethyldihydropteridine diphosphokinase [Bacteroidales bacterium]|nr:2-amino-4-hydroxy-6-hydroxymethyldihydropteridine diphosphokinase [Bacteroidales bacterium]
MARLFLGLGSNLGQREQLLKKAIDMMEEQLGPIKAQSAFYETEAWGFQSEYNFLNACVLVETLLPARECLQQTQLIEKELGRSHKTENGLYQDRTIDIDILFYDNKIIDDTDLKVPHPLMHLRRFVMEPLVEIAADFQHPILHKTCEQILNSLT